MPSEYAYDVIDKIFSDQKADALDSINNALSSAAYELVQQKKIEYAKSMGFGLQQTAQDTADELEQSLPDGTEPPEDYDYEGRMPGDPPEESKEETNETDS